MRKFDLVVIGAGIGGGSLVYNLLKQGFTGSILVVDRGETVASGASAYSAGGFRNLWTTPINQQLCTRSIELLGRFKQDMGVAIGFQQTGYLFTYYEASWKQVPKAAEIWRANQVAFDLLSPAQVEAMIPGLRCGIEAVDPEVREYLGMEAIAGGVFGRDCGSFDPSQAAVGYFERALSDFPVKPVLQLNTEAQAVTFDPAGRATGVKLKAAGVEETVQAGMVALCTGPWTNELLDRSDCAAEDRMPIKPQKRMLFMTDFPDQDPRWQTIPLTIIDQGIYFKFESGSLMIGRPRTTPRPAWTPPSSPTTTWTRSTWSCRSACPTPPHASSSAAGRTSTTPIRPTTTPSWAGTATTPACCCRWATAATAPWRARPWAWPWRNWCSPAATGPSIAPSCAGAGSRRASWSRRPSSSESLPFLRRFDLS